MRVHKTGKLIAVLLALAILIVGSSGLIVTSVQVPLSGTITNLLPLHVEGQWTVDSNGNRIQLRGAGGDYTAYSHADWLATYISWMKQTGSNCIRLAFNVPNPQSLWQEGQQTDFDFSLMDSTLNLLSQNGLYAILDCHHYWANASVQGWTDILPGFEQQWINFWVSVSQRYKNNPTIAIYELDNEPFGTTGVELRNAYYSAIQAIRATGDNHIVMVSSPERETFQYTTSPSATWNNSSQILGNMTVDIHDWYNYGQGGNQGENWFPNDAASSPNQNVTAEMVASEYVSAAVAMRAKLGCPVVLGEFGVYNYSMSSAGVKGFKLTIQMAEQYGIPWSAWMLDHWIQDSPNFWPTFVTTQLGGAFISNYVSGSIAVNQTFNYNTFPAVPVNIWNIMNLTLSYRTQENGYNFWGVTFVTIPNDNPTPTFFGPCTLRIQSWGYTRPTWGTITEEYFVTLATGQTWSASQLDANAGYTVVFAWGG